MRSRIVSLRPFTAACQSARQNDGDAVADQGHLRVGQCGGGFRGTYPHSYR
jgi:hypothetical protein